MRCSVTTARNCKPITVDKAPFLPDENNTFISGIYRGKKATPSIFFVRDIKRVSKQRDTREI